MIDWVLRAAELLLFVTLVFIAIEVLRSLRAAPRPATIARQIVAVRALVALAVHEQQSSRLTPEYLFVLDARLAALRDERTMLLHVEVQIRAIAWDLLHFALPGGKLEAASKAWLDARENGGAF